MPRAKMRAYARLAKLDIFEYYTGFRRGRILLARRLGIRTHRMTVVLLVAVNLVVGLGVS